jgi:hypothetical protein
MVIVVTCRPTSIEKGRTFTPEALPVAKGCQLAEGDEAFVWFTNHKNGGGLAAQGKLLSVSPESGRRVSLSIELHAPAPTRKFSDQDLKKYDLRDPEVVERPGDPRHRLCEKLYAYSPRRVVGIEFDEAEVLRDHFKGVAVSNREQQGSIQPKSAQRNGSAFSLAEIDPCESEIEKSINDDLDEAPEALSLVRKTETKQAAQGLDLWFETLPFPLASILRAWQATETQDFKTKHEHLLHFFEATAEFIGIILLSAFRSNEALFASHREKMIASMHKQNLSFQRATFGTWKFVAEYLGKQTRELISGDDGSRSLCAEIFLDGSLTLPVALTDIALIELISRTNKMRNDWTGHGGVVSQQDARLRNEELVSEINKLRDLLGDVWTNTQLVHALHCRPKRGVFENEIAILMGSNSEFLKETRSMATWLDVEQLYLSQRGSTQALRLLPLVKVGPAPESAKNACYFFNRLDRTGARFVSYHYADRPELKDKFSEEAIETIKLLTEG